MQDLCGFLLLVLKHLQAFRSKSLGAFWRRYRFAC